MPLHSLVVIGSGPGGFSAALDAARRGVSVTLVERDTLGGTCLNRGCIPSKFLLSHAKRRSDALRLSSNGIRFQPPALDLPCLLEKKEHLLSTLRQRMVQALKAAKIPVVIGSASVVSAHRVEVTSPAGDTRAFDADAILLAVGSSPIRPPHFPIHPAVMDSTSIFRLSELPAHLAVIGGGYIGCELACAFQGLGSRVTLIEKESRLLPTQPEFEAAANTLERSFTQRGMTVKTHTTVQSVDSAGDPPLRMTLSDGETIEVHAILTALGRSPNLHGLGLEAIGLSLNQGRLPVNTHFQTTLPSIYAVGDMVSPLPLAHTAAREAEVAVAHLCGETVPLSYAAIPRVMYTWPEAAAIGWTENDALQAGHTPRIDRYHFAANAKALAEDEPEGAWVLVSDAKTGKLLGAQIVGNHATELIHLVALGLQANASTRDVVDTVFGHPTLAEGLMETARRAVFPPHPIPGQKTL